MANQLPDTSSQEKTVYEGGDKEFKVKITIKNPEVWDEFIRLNTTFEAGFKKLFRGVVFESHKYLIRTTPIQTGRLRAGWTGILNKYQQDYTQAFQDVTLLNIRANTGKPLDPRAISEGMQESQFKDEELDVTLINSVPYIEYVEYGTSKMEGQHFTRRATYKSEYIMTKAMADWFKEIASKGSIVEPAPVEECAV